MPTSGILGGAGVAGGAVVAADAGAGCDSERVHAAVTNMAAQLKTTVRRVVLFINECRSARCSRSDSNRASASTLCYRQIFYNLPRTSRRGIGHELLQLSVRLQADLRYHEPATARERVKPAALTTC